MSTHDRPGDGELPRELRDALAALPRERTPGRLLEERTVRALREQGMIEARPAARGRLRIVRLAGAAAAGIALFLGGMAAGQWMGARQSAELVSRVRVEDSRQAAAAVQQTGSAYVAALSHLASMRQSAAAPPSDEGREVAVRMLRAAADELLRIAPDDPVAAAVLAAFQRDSAAAPPAETQRVVWF